MTRFSFKWLLFVSTLLINACTPPPSPIAAENKAISQKSRKQKLSAFTRWNIKGGLAVKEGSKGFSASMNWQQSSVDNFHIQLFGPLGSGNVNIDGEKGRTTLKDGNKTAQAGTAEALLQQLTGHHVPVSNMYYWLRGLPSPGLHSNESFDQFHHLQSLNQAGWQVSYLRYTAHKGMDLPSKMLIQRGNIKIKVIINRWL